MAKKRFTEAQLREHQKEWYRRWREKHPPAPKQPPVKKPDVCKGCGYSVFYSSLGRGCGYILITGHSRPCPAEGCRARRTPAEVRRKYGARVKAMTVNHG